MGKKGREKPRVGRVAAGNAGKAVQVEKRYGMGRGQGEDLFLPGPLSRGQRT